MSEHFSVSVPYSPAGVTLLRAAATALATVLGAPASAAAAAPAAAPEAAPVKGKPGRKPKPVEPAPAAAEAPADDDASDLNDLGGDAGADDELGLGDAAPPAKPLTLAGDVIPAFRAALDRVKGDKSKLAAVLSDYGVKSVQLLPEAKFAEVVAKLAKLK